MDLVTGGSEVAAESLGIAPASLKTRTFVIAAVYASIAGSIYTHYLGLIYPYPFFVWWSFVFLGMVVIGGTGSLWGGIIGAVIWMGISEVVSYALGSAAVSGWQSIVFALIFISCLIFCPGGLYQLGSMLWQNWSRRERNTHVESGK